MHAIILAAGKGTRMRELSKHTPKPMLSWQGKNLIEHKLEKLPESVKKVIIVVGHLKNAIVDYFGNSYKGLPIVYVTQEELLGTGHAVWQAKDFIDDRFMVLMGDDIYAKEDLENLSKHDWAMLAWKETGQGRKGGKIFLNEDGTIKDVVEDTQGTLFSPLVNTGVVVLTKEIFKYPLVQIPGRNEYGLFLTMLQEKKNKIHLVEATFWKQITSPEDLA